MIAYAYQGGRWPWITITGHVISVPAMVLYEAHVGKWIQLKNGRLTIAVDYAWKGPTGWSSAHLMRASLAHDALYQAIRLGHLPPAARAAADRAFAQIARVDGSRMASIAWVGVRLLGWWAVRRRK